METGSGLALPVSMIPCIPGRPGSRDRYGQSVKDTPAVRFELSGAPESRYQTWV